MVHLDSALQICPQRVDSMAQGVTSALPNFIVSAEIKQPAP
jgi:hypothetical protein